MLLLYHRYLIFLFPILVLFISEKETGTLDTKKLFPFFACTGRVVLGSDEIASSLCEGLSIAMDMLTEVNEGFFQSLAVPVYQKRKLLKTLVIHNQN